MMKDIALQPIEVYLKKVLGLNVSFGYSLNYDDVLPAYLASAFVFYGMRVQSRDFLLVGEGPDTEFSPSQLKTRLETIGKQLQIPVIYTANSLAKDSRRDLIKYRVSFIIPGQQLYLPELAMDFKERYSGEKPRVKSLAPLSQVSALHPLLNRTYRDFSNTDLFNKMGYSTATASRVISELSGLGILSCKSINKSQICSWTSMGKELWQRLLPYLSSPVKSFAWFSGESKMAVQYPRAGLSALSLFSRIAEPEIPVFACSVATFKNLSKTLDSRPYAWHGSILIQAWNYDPDLLGDGFSVDPLSLYLSMLDDPDERTQICLEEMLEVFTW